MKKKCSSNNAISINTSIISCVPAIPATCTDPLTYFLNTAVNLALERNITLDAATNALLLAGMVLPSGTSICCPDCTNAPIYALTNFESYATLANELNWVGSQPDIIDMCCLNLDMAVDIYANFVEIMSQKVIPECCDTNFTNCLKSYSSGVDYLDLIEDGIIEINTLNGASVVCKLFTFLQALPNSVGFNDDITEYIKDFLALGFVAYCCGCNIMIGSTTAFISYKSSGGCPELNNNPL